MSNKTKKEILDEFNEYLGEDFKNFQQLLDHLSDMFCKEYDTFDEAQVAFDSLNDDLDEKLGEYFCYSLGTQNWTVQAEDTEDTAEDILNLWNNSKNPIIKTVDSYDELASAIESYMMKDMSNAGCDANSSFEYIMNEVYSTLTNAPFKLNYGELSPRIILIDDLFK